MGPRILGPKLGPSLACRLARPPQVPLGPKESVHGPVEIIPGVFSMDMTSATALVRDGKAAKEDAPDPLTEGKRREREGKRRERQKKRERERHKMRQRRRKDCLPDPLTADEASAAGPVPAHDPAPVSLLKGLAAWGKRGKQNDS